VAKVVTSLLSLSRNDENEFELIKIDLLMKMTLDFCYPFLEKNDVELRFVDNIDTLEAECNVTQISQVLINLIKNASDAVADYEDKWVLVVVTEKESTILIEVIDSGSGISQEIQDKMLMPFFTTKSIGEGTGLGLSISRKILEVHGSELLIDNESANTCFYFELKKKQLALNQNSN